MPNTTIPVSYFGNPVQNEVLTALAPADVPANLVGYQWQSSIDGVTWVSIAAATANTFTLTQAQVGSAIRVLVTTSAVSDTPVQNVNDLPVGTVDISGTSAGGAKEGDQLSVTTAKLIDLDGLGTFHYQWQSMAAGATGWTDISGATNAQLTLAQANVGASIRAKVTYTDGGGTQETVFSAATGSVANTNNAPTGAIAIALQSDSQHAAPAMVGTGATLVASNTLADTDGMGAVQYQWQKQSKDVSGAAVWLDIDQAGTDTLAVSTLAGKTVRVLASYTDAFGTKESVASASVLVNDLPSGAASIGGTLTQGQTLTASNTLQDANGLGTVHYQWLADGAAVSGASAATFTLTQAQVGKSMSVQASYTDLGGTAEVVTSTLSAKVVNIDDLTTGTLAFSGNATDGATLSAVTSGLTDLDGVGSFTYQWQVLNGADWQNLSGKTSATLALTQANVGQTLRLSAVHTDLGGYTASLVSEAKTVTNTNDAPTGTVTLDGTPAQGANLVANITTLQDADGLGTLHYRWESQSAAGQWTTIAGATGSTLALTSDLGSKKIHAIVSYTDGYGTAESLISASSTPFKAANWTNSTPTGGVTVAGYTMVAQTLKATNTLTDADWISSPVSYHWQVSSNGSSAWSNIVGATSDSLALTLAQQGKYVRSVADYTDGFGTHEVVYSAASAVIAHANYAPKFAKATVYSKVFENSSFVSQAYATNTDPGDTVTYTVTGANADLFQVVGAALQFKAAPNFESVASQAAKNHYVVNLVATDAFGLSAQQTVTVDVLNVNEAPTWVESSRTVFVKDGTALVDNVRGAHLLDPDLTDNVAGTSTPPITLGGTDAGLFTSTQAGKLSFTSAALKAQKLSAPADHSYHLELIATDKGGLSTDTQFLTVQTVNLLGTTGNDTLVGTAADDRLAGLAGNDTLTGGTGRDTFFVSEGKDSITDLGNGADVLNVAAGAEVAANVTANWTATAQTVNLGTATLTASASVDLSAVLSGNGFALDAAASNLTLTGSRGADTFVLHAGMVDTVLGFESGKDSISFKGLAGMAVGAVASNAFVSGAGLTAATNPDQHLILNTTTGDLYFDADGNGDATAILLAHFSPGALPTLADLHVVAVI